MKHVGRRALVGGLSTVGGNLAAFLIRFSVTATLARLLSPSMFGTYAMASALAAGPNIIQALSFPQALLQLDDTHSGLFTTVRRMTLVLNLGVAIAAGAVAPIVARLTSPDVAWCFFVLILIQGGTTLSQCWEAWLQRRFRYHLVASLRVVSAVISLALAAPAAIIFSNALVLTIRDVVPLLVTLAVLPVVVHRVRARDPEFASYNNDAGWNNRTARAVWGLGRALFVTRALEVVVGKIDALVVGVTLGNTALGFYDQARYLAGLPNATVAPFSQSTALRTFAALESDPTRRYRAFVLTQWGVARMVAMCALVFLVAPDLPLGLFYGARWVAAAPFLQGLALWALFRPLMKNHEVLLIATKKFRPVQVSYFVGAVTVALAIGPLTWAIGPRGVPIAVTAAELAMLVQLAIATWRIAPLPVATFTAPALSMAIGALGGFATRAMLPSLGLHPLPAAALAASVAISIYGLSILAIEGRDLREQVTYLWGVARARG